MGLRELESMLGCPREHLEFTLWYLKGKAVLEPTDHGHFTITPEGVDDVEAREADESRPMPPLLPPAPAEQGQEHQRDDPITAHA